jgi:hypothetical protein
VDALGQLRGKERDKSFRPESPCSCVAALGFSCGIWILSTNLPSKPTIKVLPQFGDELEHMECLGS